MNGDFYAMIGVIFASVFGLLMSLYEGRETRPKPLEREVERQADQIRRLQAEIAAKGRQLEHDPFGACPHDDCVAVDTIYGETVAAICLTCDEQLPPAYAGRRLNPHAMVYGLLAKSEMSAVLPPWPATGGAAR